MADLQEVVLLERESSCRPTAPTSIQWSSLRQAQDPAPKSAGRIANTTWKPIAVLLDCFMPQECANYIVNVGYAS